MAQSLPCLLERPLRKRRAEPFWNSFSCDLTIAGLQSVPAFLPRRVSLGPRSFRQRLL
jgi:hypothetical protein